MAGLNAVLLITGAWHVPDHYYKLIPELESHGIRVICECLPTNNNPVPPNKTIQDDIDFIKDLVSKEVSAGTHLTVIAHSWGGILASAALASFAVPPESKEGGVTGMIFVAAFVPFENDSLAGLFGGKLPPTLVPQSNGTLVPTDPIHLFYHDLPEEEAQWTKNTMVAHGTDVQYTPINCQKVAWRVVPLTYIICEEDQGLLSFLQEGMIEKVEEQGVVIQKYRFPSSHSPFLSMPKKLANIVLEVMCSR
ncbi:alpha beta hydrolase family domain-containing protein [Fusarium pseudocircinatum]|uniref:Alpha beta hydrolase family domain-containing protein n=1 Tax=Fusarium pseudocircinatum TaxID=56676 RepID=A0A8H5PZP3_9HYPO|nr:alpha beta hydrolase family domain-containing protein [Fusarium pseudocircinatum]